jgi:hypothetical protein
MISGWINDFKDLVGVGESNEFYDSTQIALKDRVTSPFYGYFLISWILVNWKFIYIAFFIDQEILIKTTGLLRNEYLNNLVPAFSPSFWLHFFIVPFTVTVLAFWVFPYVTRIFFRKNLRNHIALKVIELRETSRSTKAKTDLVQVETELIKKESKKARQEKKAEQETPEVVWEKEFEDFKKTLLYSKFDYIIQAVYEHNGDILVPGQWNESSPVFHIPKDILAFSHTSDLVTMDKVKGKIELTPKGKFFVKKSSS